MSALSAGSDIPKPAYYAGKGTSSQTRREEAATGTPVHYEQTVRERVYFAVFQGTSNGGQRVSNLRP